MSESINGQSVQYASQVWSTHLQFDDIVYKKQEKTNSQVRISFFSGSWHTNPKISILLGIQLDM